MNVPARSAALISSSPGRAVAGRPSRTKGIDPSSEAWSSAGALATSVKGARPFLDVQQELVAEHLDGRGDGRGDRRPEHADGRLLGRPVQPRRDVVAHVEQQVEVLLTTIPVLDAVQDALQPARA